MSYENVTSSANIIILLLVVAIIFLLSVRADIFLGPATEGPSLFVFLWILAKSI